MGINNLDLSRIDIGIIVFIGMFCILGFIKGVVRQFFGILAFILASAASIFVPYFIDLPNIGSASPVPGHIILSILIWIPAFLILNSIGKFIAKRMTKRGVKFSGRLWGLIFGGIKGSIILILIVFLMDIFPIAPDVFRESRIVSLIQPYNPLLKINIMQNLEIIISSLNDPDYMDILANDPGFQRLKDNETIRLILNDPELKKILSEHEFLKFITHPKIQMLIKDKEAMGLLLTTDIDKAVISNI